MVEAQRERSTPGSVQRNFESPSATTASKLPANSDLWDTRSLRDALPKLPPEDEDEDKDEERGEEKQQNPSASATVIADLIKDTNSASQSQIHSSQPKHELLVSKPEVLIASSASKRAPRYSKGDMIKMKTTQDEVTLMRPFTVFAVSQKENGGWEYQLTTTKGELWDCGVWVRENILRPRKV